MLEEYLDSARDELTDQLIYEKLAERERNLHNREWLLKLAAQEKGHGEFWQSFIPETTVVPYRLSLWGIPFLNMLLGVTFTTKFLERREEEAIARYERMLPSIPAQNRTQLQKIIADEKEHERELIGQLKEKRVAYIGFIALGLADAIVEITGVHAGFLGVTRSTLITGISGIIVGVAASISMGSASYLQAKQEPEKSAIVSGFTTGFSYLGSVILLALPYFLIRTMLIAFIVSTSVGIILLASFTFYSAVVFDRQFLREFGEAAGLMLGTALITYILGNVIGGIFHLNANNF